MSNVASVGAASDGAGAARTAEQPDGLLEFPAEDELIVDPADVGLCPDWERRGTCRREDDCPLIHGDFCEVGLSSRGRGGWSCGLLLGCRELMGFLPAVRP